MILIIDRRDNLLKDIPCGLVVRIRRFHRRGRGSIPRTGVKYFINFDYMKKKMYFDGLIRYSYLVVCEH